MLWKDVPIIYSFLSDGGLFDGILCAANFWPKRAVEFFGFERCDSTRILKKMYMKLHINMCVGDGGGACMNPPLIQRPSF